jgi:hypothetical protein
VGARENVHPQLSAPWDNALIFKQSNWLNAKIFGAWLLSFRTISDRESFAFKNLIENLLRIA